MVGNPLSYAFWAGSDQNLTAEQLKRRQAVAAALAGQKRTFPKNIGEGIASLGQDIGDAMQERRLLAAEQDLARRRAADQGPLLGGAAAPGAAALPGVPAGVASNFGLGGGPPPPTAPPPDQTAAVEDTDADRLSRIALALTDNAVGGASPNPPLAAGPSVVSPGPSRRYAALPPATATDATEQEETPTDIPVAPPTVLAQAGGAPGASTVPGGSAGAPAPAGGPARDISDPLTPAQPGAGAVPVPELPPGVTPRAADPRFTRASNMPPAPTPPPINNFMLEGIAMSRRWPGDEVMQARAKQIYEHGAKLRADLHARAVDQWKADVARAEKEALAEQEYSRNLPKLTQEMQAKQIEMDRTRRETELKAEELAQKQREQRVSEQLGGLTTQQYVDGVIKPSVAEVKNVPGAIQSITTAQEMLRKGIYSGAGANIAMSRDRLWAAGGAAADPRIANTQTFQTSMGPLIAQMRQAIAGNANISDKDVALAERMSGGDVTLDAETIRRVLESAQKAVIFNSVQHQKKLARYGGGDQNRVDAAYGSFGLPMERIVPPAVVDRLRKAVRDAGSDAAKVEAELLEFDQDFATPGLARRLLRGR